MKLTIKIKRFNTQFDPQINAKGDWIDLRANKTVKLTAPQSGRQHQVENEKVRDVSASVTYIPLGVAMKLPSGFEAWVISRSGTPEKENIIMANSFGLIDQTYHGNNDEWKYPAIALDNTTIEEGDRICQFRIFPSQFASVWQKLKWLFTSGVKLEFVSNLEGENRGGFGHSGVK